jgi:hypothetical protein
VARAKHAPEATPSGPGQCHAAAILGDESGRRTSIRADVLAVDEKLNPRQATLVTAFLEHARLTLADCERLFPDVARRTREESIAHEGELLSSPTTLSRGQRYESEHVLGQQGPGQ